jgi:hypothetical protein
MAIVDDPVNSSGVLKATNAEAVTGTENGKYMTPQTSTKTEIGKNFIINGTFDIWQRATSQTATGYGSDDRWNNIITGSTQVASQQTFTLGQTDVPNNPTYYARTVVTSVAGAGNLAFKYQPIEGVESLSGTTAVVDFYAKADTSKNIALELFQSFGTTGSPSTGVSIPVQLIALTASWQHFQIEVAIPSITGKTLGSDGNDALQLILWMDAGSTHNARAASLGQQSGTFDFSEIKIYEKGKQCEPRRSVGEELALCKRYYHTVTRNVGGYWYVVNGYPYSNTENYPVTMRAAPTLVKTRTSTNLFYAATNSISSDATGHATYVVSNATGQGNYFYTYTADAEL